LRTDGLIRCARTGANKGSRPTLGRRNVMHHGNRGYNGNREKPLRQDKEGYMAKFHARPSLQYRYEHYDPFVA